MQTMKRTRANISIFLATTVLLWVGLSVLDFLGYLRPIDTACLEIGAVKHGFGLGHLDGILIILLFAALPGIGVVLWKTQAVILCTVIAFLVYYGLAYFCYHNVGYPLPVVAPFLAAIASLLRGFGYHPSIDVEWTRRHSSFISYRREGGADIALLVAAELGNRGFPTFIDVKGLGASHFDTQLLKRIEENPNFVVVLSPGALDRCVDADDWLRREISYAIATRRNIVPVMTPGFTFPALDDLPKDMSELPRHNAVIYSREFPSSTIDKLVAFLKQSRAGQNGNA